VTDQLDQFQYSEPLNSLYKFFWNDFCDWYLEWVKPRMQDEEQRPVAQNVLAFVLDQTLRLLHPFVPFITEGIFQKLNEIAPVRHVQGLATAKESEALVAAKWPEQVDSLVDESAERQIQTIQCVIRAIRDVRSKYNKPPGEMLSVSAKLQGQDLKLLSRNAELICQLAGVKQLKVGTDVSKPANAAVAIADAAELYVDDVIDVKAEQKRLKKQRERIEKAKKALEAKLTNENFVAKAKPQVVAQARDRMAELAEQLKTVEKHLSEL
jgi:valyl-tRNA synthetase